MNFLRATFFGLAGTLAAVAGAEPIYWVTTHGVTKYDTSYFTGRPKAVPDQVVTANGITFNITYKDASGSVGFGTANPDSAARRARLADALTYVANVLNQPGTLDIECKVSQTDGNGFLASAGPFFSSDPGYSNGTAFERLTTGVKPFADTPEIQVTVDFGHEYNVGTGAPTGSQNDLTSVLIHELTHGLGLLSLSTSTGTSALGGSAPNTFSVFDSFIRRKTSGVLLFHGAGPSFGGALADLTSNDLDWDGPLAKVAFGSRPPIFAPLDFQPGSSIAHWDQSTNGIMTPALITGTALREYKPFEIAALRDLGYTLAADPGATDTAPVITLTGAASITVECGTAYVDAGATALDVPDGNITSSIVTGGLPIDTAAVGVHIVTYNVTDSTSHAATQVSRTVTVNDTQAPVVTLNGAAALSIACGEDYVEAGATALDTCDGAIAVSITGTVNTDVPGVYTLNYQATDSHSHSATKTRSITITGPCAEGEGEGEGEGEPDLVPVITRIGAASVTVECGGTYTDAGATASDVPDGDIISSIVTTGLPIDTSSAGAHTVTYNVTDSTSHAAIAVTRTVTVSDTLAPVVTLTGAASISIPCGGVYTEAGATANDACDGALAVSITGSVNTNVPGVYTVTYQATDSHSHSATKTRSVTVTGPCGEGEGEGEGAAEGEGEGEGQVDVSGPAQALLDAFDQADTNNDGLLNLGEAQARGIAANVFAVIDANHDSRITQQELLDAGAVQQAGGCNCAGSGKALWKKLYGDGLIYALSAVILGIAAMRRGGSLY